MIFQAHPEMRHWRTIHETSPSRGHLLVHLRDFHLKSYRWTPCKCIENHRRFPVCFQKLRGWKNAGQFAPSFFRAFLQLSGCFTGTDSWNGLIDQLQFLASADSVGSESNHQSLGHKISHLCLINVLKCVFTGVSGRWFSPRINQGLQNLADSLPTNAEPRLRWSWIYA